MTSGLGLFDAVLTLLLSNGMIVFAVLLLIAAIIILFANKKKRTPIIKGICIAVIICCTIYLAFILTLVIGFGSNGHPPVPN